MMKFDTPAGPNPTDKLKVLDKPYDRIDGPLKVSGQAPYAYEYQDAAPNAAYGVVVTSTIGKGRIDTIDTSDAERAPGVLMVMTHLNAPKQNDRGSPQLQGAEIKQYGQAVALVVANTFEQATAAAQMLHIGYSQEKGRFSLDLLKDGELSQRAGNVDMGDFAGAFAGAPAKVDVTYTTPNQSHAMMEPHASTAVWHGDKLTLYLAHQVMHWVTSGVAGTIGIPEANIRAVSAYVGGGFGSKLVIYADAILASLAARKLGRPVKIALTRGQIFNHTTHRAQTMQHLRLAAGRDGKLVAVGHATYTGDQPGGGGEHASGQTKLLYAGKNRLIQTYLAELDLPKAGAMRAPGEAVGLLALENAMDELAEQLDMDPVELRVVNDIQYDPEVGPDRPFSERKLVQCLRTGAERFGWSKRNPKPGQVRDGQWLVGMGVSAGIRGNPVTASGTRVTLRPDGTVLVESAMTDIGTGSYTINAQTAAEMLGVPMAAVEVRLGDSALPRASGSGGSWGANSSTSGTYAACWLLRRMLAEKAGFDPEQAQFADGAIAAGDKRVALKSLVGGSPVTAVDSIEFGDLTKKYAQASFGAHFAEVGVDMHTGEPRVRRLLSVCSIGRVLNPKTARSQCLGGMTMGVGSALMEDLIVDPRFGYFVNHDMAEYQVPVHADIPDLDVVFLEGEDNKSSPMKARGVGELGICGVGAAVTNAIYNACGVRVRDYPATMDKILAGLMT
ncbi:xanthine dehydrogenase family protein molybdopterin-binding subunit [Stakelama sediminis]|uniref:Xanthine dehydrogenase YagR molybdenum-binding subunit n=2 Tax=Stakelama sediminis TaxID=463200 RepID=A0A840YWK4_9SPHN|nr:xanthine dehydrogenase YagR molybdenum-binding subunit [Stakelama sediminis]